jgi:hypothetical protein
LFIKPLEQTDEPFRIVGIYICGFWAESGDMGGNVVANGVKDKDDDTSASSLADETEKEKKNDTSNVNADSRKEDNVDIRSAAAGAKNRKTGDPKNVYYGVINNRYRE